MGKILSYFMRTLFMVLAVGLTSFGSISVELKEVPQAPLKRIKNASYQYEGEPQKVKFFENEANIFYYYEPIDEFVTVIYEDDTTQRAGEALPCVVVPFYYDTRFRYEFGAPESPYITVYFKDGTEMNVVDALEQGKIFIKDLDEFGIRYHREKRRK